MWSGLTAGQAEGNCVWNLSVEYHLKYFSPPASDSFFPTFMHLFCQYEFFEYLLWARHT